MSLRALTFAVALTILANSRFRFCGAFTYIALISAIVIYANYIRIVVVVWPRATTSRPHPLMAARQ